MENLKIDETVMTLSYIRGKIEEIKIGEKYFFGQLWDGKLDGEELLDFESISTDGENIVDFTIIEKDEDNIRDSLVMVTGIF